MHTPRYKLVTYKYRLNITVAQRVSGLDISMLITLCKMAEESLVAGQVTVGRGRVSLSCLQGKISGKDAVFLFLFIFFLNTDFIVFCISVFHFETLSYC